MNPTGKDAYRAGKRFAKSIIKNYTYYARETFEEVRDLTLSVLKQMGDPLPHCSLELHRKFDEGFAVGLYSAWKVRRRLSDK